MCINIYKIQNKIMIYLSINISLCNKTVNRFCAFLILYIYIYLSIKQKKRIKCYYWAHLWMVGQRVLWNVVLILQHFAWFFSKIRFQENISISAQFLDSFFNGKPLLILSVWWKCRQSVNFISRTCAHMKGI